MAATRNEDLLAIDVYQHAQDIGETPTLGMVERRLDELRGHDTGSVCGRCTAAAAVRPAGVW